VRGAVKVRASDKGGEVVHLQVFPGSGGYSEVYALGISAPYAHAETREHGEVIKDEKFAGQYEVVIDIAVETEGIIVDVYVEPQRSLLQTICSDCVPGPDGRGQNQGKDYYSKLFHDFSSVQMMICLDQYQDIFFWLLPKVLAK
jgi:hypothetical protein